MMLTHKTMITLSAETQAQLHLSSENTLSQQNILTRLQQESTDSVMQQACLHALLLNDLYHGLFILPAPKPSPPPPSLFNQWLFYGLALAGTIYALASGFNGIVSFLMLSSSFPSWVIVFAGLCFSILSIALFYGFGLVSIAEDLNITLTESRHMLDAMAEQKILLRQIKDHLLAEQAQEQRLKQTQPNLELRSASERHQIALMLLARYRALEQIRDLYTEHVSDIPVHILTFGIEVVLAMVFFNGGFASGQALAMALIGAFMSSVSTTFWPVILISVVVAVSVLSLYWFVQRPQLETLIGRWLGRDPEKIALLFDQSDLQAFESLVETSRTTGCATL